MAFRPRLIGLLAFAMAAALQAAPAAPALQPEAAPAAPASQPEAAALQAAPAEESYDETEPVRIASLEIPDNFPRLCRRFALLLETRHYLQKPLDAAVSRQAWSNYISRLDYDHSIFIQPDIDEFKAWENKLHNDLKTGDLSFAVTVFERFKQRLVERFAFVEKFLDGEHDFTADEEYVWKRKDLPWPKDAAEQDELWRKRMTNELLSRIAARDYAKEKAEKEEKEEDSATDEETADPAADEEAADPTADEEAADAADTATADSASPTNAPPVPAIDMSPESVVRRRYKQLLDIVSDADADYVIERFLCAFAEVYDPHTAYMPPSRAEDFNIEMNLTLCGIGATLQSEDGMAKIVKIIPGGPADRDTRDIRLRDGDKIFGVGQGDGPVEDIVHLPLDKIVKRIRGKKGTKVVLHVISASDPSGATTKVVDLIRDDIKLEESAATGRVVRVEGRAFGYVRLPSFYGTMGNPGDPNFRSCTKDVLDIVKGFDADTEGMILDLRGNGGGSLREAVTLTGSFISSGPVVAVRENRGAQPLSDMDAAIAFRKPLVVMIDRASASASEIVAAALQDYGRAVIVGDSKSHGKGSVQNVMPLINGDDSYGTLKITIAAFYRINGGSTQINGVSSDIVLPSLMEYMELGEDKLPNALPWTKIPPMPYQLAYPLGSVIAGLREKSAARLADNADWQKHLKRVEHVREMSNRTSISLSYEKRMAQMRADAEFDLGEDYLLDEEGEDDGEAGDEPAGEEDISGADGGEDADGAGQSEQEDGSVEKPEVEKDDGIGEDIVLREAFNILADLCTAQGANGISASQQQEVLDWIYRYFK